MLSESENFIKKENEDLRNENERLKKELETIQKTKDSLQEQLTTVASTVIELSEDLERVNFSYISLQDDCKTVGTWEYVRRLENCRARIEHLENEKLSPGDEDRSLSRAVLRHKETLINSRNLRRCDLELYQVLSSTKRA